MSREVALSMTKYTGTSGYRIFSRYTSLIQVSADAGSLVQVAFDMGFTPVHIHQAYFGSSFQVGVKRKELSPEVEFIGHSTSRMQVSVEEEEMDVQDLMRGMSRKERSAERRACVLVSPSFLSLC